MLAVQYLEEIVSLFCMRCSSIEDNKLETNLLESRKGSIDSCEDTRYATKCPRDQALRVVLLTWYS